MRRTVTWPVHLQFGLGALDANGRIGGIVRVEFGGDTETSEGNAVCWLRATRCRREGQDDGGLFISTSCCVFGYGGDDRRRFAEVGRDRMIDTLKQPSDGVDSHYGRFQ